MAERANNICRYNYLFVVVVVVIHGVPKSLTKISKDEFRS